MAQFSFASLLAPRLGLLSCFAAFGALFLGVKSLGIIARSSLSSDASRAALSQRGEQTHALAAFVSHKMPVRQRKGPHETGVVVALTGTKTPCTALGKGKRAGKCGRSSSLLSLLCFNINFSGDSSVL